ncbi:hypothetical protein D2T29_12895 [Sinirhodobacter populi]|uniref:HD/PDEase domain-containing protein n=1 Tax=Paenirhodobacter populi TaxID=2306993 RepID=A0A443KD87_9RHOB|nr:TraI domain-containing protein [Sinirhodobacter populi]RWR30563.1 hypothetical protein D2T29_12895 [Sinirhodobacter populi]
MIGRLFGRTKHTDTIAAVGGSSSAVEAAEPSAEPRSKFDYSAEDFLHESNGTSIPADLLRPDKEGIEVTTTAELMEANRALIRQALDAFVNKQYIPNFDREIVECVRRVAHWMGPIPASKSWHHLNRGGLFAHTVAVAVGSLHLAQAKNLTLGSAPREKLADELAWQLVCFIGGMLHDIGKMHTIGNVLAHSVYPDPRAERTFRSSAAPIYANAWQPMVEGFEKWSETNRVRTFYIDYDIGETLEHSDFTTRYVQALVPRTLLAFIYNSSGIIRQQFEDFIRNPESSANTPVFQVVRDADQLNVAQSLDPRRRPGSIEMTGLVVRRFAEFASSVTWNLSTSPFIYANVQKMTPDGLRYLAMPFFVVNEATIKAFMRFIEERPFLGVIFGDRMTEMVFNSLEMAKVMHRTIEGILPNQITQEGLLDYIPASRAMVRFKAKRSGIITNPNEVIIEDAIVELSVIPVSARAPANWYLDPPTLAFVGAPAPQPAVSSVRVAIRDGAMTPEDPALRNDPEFITELNQIVKAQALSEQDRALLDTIKPAATKPEKSNLDDIARDAAGPVAKTTFGVRQASPTLSESEQVARKGSPEGQGPIAEDPEAKLPDLVFLKVLSDISEDGKPLTVRERLVVLWFFAREVPSAGQKTFANPKNARYGFAGADHFQRKLRDAFAAALHDGGADFPRILDFWPDGRLGATNPAIRDNLEVTNSEGKGTVMSFRAMESDLIEVMIDKFGEPSAVADQTAR